MLTGLLMAVMTVMAGPQPVPETPYVVVYSIQDLEKSLPRFTEMPTIDLESSLKGRGATFTSQPAPRPFPNDNPEGLMNLIKAVVEPNAWGDTATMTYWEGNIVVRATKSIHDQIK